MGFLDGFLGGVVTQRRQEEQQNREDAQNAQVREDAVLQHLSTSDDPEIRALAVAGILDSTHPKRKQGGFGGWLGKVQSNPHMDRIRQLVAHDQELGKNNPEGQALTTAPPTAGPAGPSLAQPGGKSLTEVGSAPPSPTASVPGQDPTPEVAPPEAAASNPIAAVLGRAAPAATAVPLPPAPLNPTAPLDRPVPDTAPAGPTGVPQTGASAKIAATPGPQVGPATSPETAGAPPPTGPAGAPPLAVLGQATPPVGAGPLSPRGDVFRSPETQIRLSKKASAQGDVEGEVAGLVASGFSEPEARALIKAKMERAARGGYAAARPVQGTMTDPATGKTSTVFAIWDPGSRQFLHPDTQELMPGFQPKPTGAGANPFFGQDREAIARRIYGRPFNQLTPEEAADVDQKRTEQLQSDANARGTGAGQAAFNKPIGVSEAQRTNTQVGASSAQYSGQPIPSNAEQDQRRGIEGVRGQLEHVKTLVAAALPKQGELGAVAPGATLAVRRRSPQYRVQVAQLESALDNVVNVLARTVGQQRGAQTEQDATRAYNTVVAMKARLLDPLAGDTVESAQARIAETLQYLDVVLKGLPAAPVPGAGAGASAGVGGPPPAPEAAPGAPAAAAASPAAQATVAAPPPAPFTPAAITPMTSRQTPAAKAGVTPGKSAAGPAGMTMVNGVLYKDGKPY